MTKSTITVMLALAASVLMSACVHHHAPPPRAKPGPAHKGGNFCPPGQAKKGNC